MLYEIRANQGDDYAEWIVDAPAHRRGRIPGAVWEHAVALVDGWMTHGAGMATARYSIGELYPARIGYQTGTRFDAGGNRSAVFVELASDTLRPKAPVS